MFARHDSQGYVQALDGVQRRTPVHGARRSLSSFCSKADTRSRAMRTRTNRTGYLVSGHMRLSIGATPHDGPAGDSWCVPGGVEHRRGCPR